MIFRQLFEPLSSTCTYLLGCEDTGEAVLIDPVVNSIERDLALMASLGLKLAWTLDTHIHADHITAALHLKQQVGSRIAAPAIDRLPCTDHGVLDGVPFAVGSLALRPLHTPGHTDGHFAYALDDRVFTGDALLIDGCGRTDFQNGDAAALYASVTGKLFALADECLVYPGARLPEPPRLLDRPGEAAQPAPGRRQNARGVRADHGRPRPALSEVHRLGRARQPPVRRLPRRRARADEGLLRPHDREPARLSGERRLDIVQPLKIAIMAMGGEGGGVLADWIVDLGEANGYLAQTTSVPGVAQRTGATIYYVELYPAAQAEADGAQPVLALMPLPGDVDVVLASELMEGGRAIQRGLVTPDRTTLLASTHRVYSITEKTALGDGRVDSDALLAHAAAAAKRFVRFDMAAVAEQNGSVIGAVLFGALAGTGVLPFRRAQFEATIARSGVGVASSLKAFAAAYAQVQGGTVDAPAPAAEPLHGDVVAQPAAAALDGATEAPACARRRHPTRMRRSAPRAAPAGPIDPRVRALLEPDRARVSRRRRAPMLREGVRRLIDYQDPAYADLYLDRLAQDRGAGRRRRPPARRDRAPPRALDVLRGHDPGRGAEDPRHALRARPARGPRRPRPGAGDRRVPASRRAGDRRDVAGSDRPRGRAAGLAAPHGRALHPQGPDRHHQLARRLPHAPCGGRDEALAPLDHPLRRRERGDRGLAGADRRHRRDPIPRSRSRWRSASAWSRATATPTSAACATSRR